ncbi:MAG: hypothetical protein U7126_28145 [Microcoleus sp.]
MQNPDVEARLATSKVTPKRLTSFLVTAGSGHSRRQVTFSAIMVALPAGRGNTTIERLCSGEIARTYSRLLLMIAHFYLTSDRNFWHAIYSVLA